MTLHWPSMGRFADALGNPQGILRHAWKHRHENDTATRLAHELAFLPANLELIETPPHPAPIWTGRILMAVGVVTLLLVTFGRLDIVAIAPGQLIPNANVKIVQPAVTGVVHSIRVENGDRVLAGQLLIELDPTLASADASKAKGGKIDAQLTMARAQALLRAQESNLEPQVGPVAEATDIRQAVAQSFASATFREYRQRLASSKAELQKRQAELSTTRQEIAKLEQTVPIAQAQANDYEALSQDKYVASHDYLEKKKTAIEQNQELAVQRSHAQELLAGIEKQRLDIDATVTTFRREQWEMLNKAEQEVSQTQDEQKKADARQELMQLRSPVTGVVQQLNVHSVGGVVTSAQPLMEIVPDDVLEVEARVSNKDIGFVDAGQRVIVKITTFPYARFGYLTGKVIKVANDATVDKKLGPVFLARIEIPSNRFKVENKWVNLSPGMEVTAEIKTGQRRVWQYFLSPLIETGHEGLRER